MTKADLAKDLDIDFLIDDQIKHVKACAELGIKGLLYGDYSWNKTDEIFPNITKVKNWQETLEYFKKEI